MSSMSFDQLDPVYARCKGQLIDSENGMCHARHKCARYLAYKEEYIIPHHSNGDSQVSTPIVVDSYIRRDEENCKKYIMY